MKKENPKPAQPPNLPPQLLFAEEESREVEGFLAVFVGEEADGFVLGAADAQAGAPLVVGGVEQEAHLAAEEAGLELQESALVPDAHLLEVGGLVGQVEQLVAALLANPKWVD